MLSMFLMLVQLVLFVAGLYFAFYKFLLKHIGLVDGLAVGAVLGLVLYFGKTQFPIWLSVLCGIAGFALILILERFKICFWTFGLIISSSLSYLIGYIGSNQGADTKHFWIAFVVALALMLLGHIVTYRRKFGGEKASRKDLAEAARRATPVTFYSDGTMEYGTQASNA